MGAWPNASQPRLLDYISTDDDYYHKSCRNCQTLMAVRKDQELEETYIEGMPGESMSVNKSNDELAREGLEQFHVELADMMEEQLSNPERLEEKLDRHLRARLMNDYSWLHVAELNEYVTLAHNGTLPDDGPSEEVMNDANREASKEIHGELTAVNRFVMIKMGWAPA
jgi:hypothetical protein